MQDGDRQELCREGGCSTRRNVWLSFKDIIEGFHTSLDQEESKAKGHKQNEHAVWEQSRLLAFYRIPAVRWYLGS